MTAEITILSKRLADIELSDDFMTQATENFEISLAALSVKNRKEYEATLRMWSGYAHQNGLNQLDFDLKHVKSFLTNDDWSFNTRKTRLAHLRKFAELLALADHDNTYGFSNNFGRLSLLKPKALGGDKNVANHRVLRPKQIYKIFDSLIGDSNQKTRDKAILGVLFLAGLRASEVVALQWEHVNFVDNLIYVYEGKGDKSANIPMLGDLPILLARWRSYQGTFGHYKFVFCQIYRSDKLGTDKQPSTRLVSYVISKICKATGINFTPHDTRRTAITTLLDAGATVPQTRDFARHSSGETTLRYAAKSDAMALGSLLAGKLKYGGVLGDMKQGEQARNWECSNGHEFYAIHADTCIICGSHELVFQKSIFDL